MEFYGTHISVPTSSGQVSHDRPDPPTLKENEVLLDVIFTYRGMRQDFSWLVMPIGMTECDLLHALLNPLSNVKLARLTKISTASMDLKHASVVGEMESLRFYCQQWPWLACRFGKFYFNAERNQDEDTVELKKFRDEMWHTRFVLGRVESARQGNTAFVTSLGELCASS